MVRVIYTEYEIYHKRINTWEDIANVRVAWAATLPPQIDRVCIARKTILPQLPGHKGRCWRDNCRGPWCTVCTVFMCVCISIFVWSIFVTRPTLLNSASGDYNKKSIARCMLLQPVRGVYEVCVAKNRYKRAVSLKYEKTMDCHGNDFRHYY